MTTKILMGGRRMGKTTAAQAWAEWAEQQMRARLEDDLKMAIGAPAASAGTISTAAHPWSTKTSEEILEDIRRVGETVKSATGGTIPPPIGVSPMGILDSVAGAAAGLARNLKENEMDDTTKKQLESIGAALMQRNAFVGGAFGLTGPMQLTIKTRQSQYKKKAFLGDETFTLSSHYIGKKDMILVFKNTRPVDYAFMEMPLDEALTALKGFKEFADAAGGGDIHGTLANIETIKTQERRAEQAVLMQDPEFASW